MTNSTSSTLPDDTPIYRYMPIFRFIQLVEQGFYISTANNFEDGYDVMIPFAELSPEANRYKDELIEQIQNESSPKAVQDAIKSTISRFQNECGKSTHSQLTEEKIRELADDIAVSKNVESLFEILDREAMQATLISCWNMSPEESYLMWKSYAKNGVRIKTTIEKFRNHIKESAKNAQTTLLNNTGIAFRDGDIYNATLQIIKENPIEYLPQEEFKKQSELRTKDPAEVGAWFFKKLAAYREEQEYRFILGGTNSAPEFTKKLRGIYPKGLVAKNVRVSSIIDEVLISPLIDSKEREVLMSFLENITELKEKTQNSSLPIKGKNSNEINRGKENMQTSKNIDEIINPQFLNLAKDLNPREVYDEAEIFLYQANVSEFIDRLIEGNFEHLHKLDLAKPPLATEGRDAGNARYTSTVKSFRNFLHKSFNEFSDAYNGEIKFHTETTIEIISDFITQEWDKLSVETKIDCFKISPNTPPILKEAEEFRYGLRTLFEHLFCTFMDFAKTSSLNDNRPTSNSTH